MKWKVIYKQNKDLDVLETWRKRQKPESRNGPIPTMFTQTVSRLMLFAVIKGERVHGGPDNRFWTSSSPDTQMETRSEPAGYISSLSHKSHHLIRYAVSSHAKCIVGAPQYSLLSCTAESAWRALNSKWRLTELILKSKSQMGPRSIWIWTLFLWLQMKRWEGLKPYAATEEFYDIWAPITFDLYTVFPHFPLKMKSALFVCTFYYKKDDEKEENM